MRRAAPLPNSVRASAAILISATGELLKCRRWVMLKTDDTNEGIVTGKLDTALLWSALSITVRRRTLAEATG
jgi:hypothetical protein